MKNTNTAGFYKNEDGLLVHGPNYVHGGGFSLVKENKDSYQYPIFGWHWFESEEEAREFLNIPKTIESPLPQSIQNYLNNREYNA